MLLPLVRTAFWRINVFSTWAIILIQILPSVFALCCSCLLSGAFAMCALDMFEFYINTF